MADRYWNPAANANWNDANVWATVDGGDPTGVTTPTSSDDVYFTSTNNKNCTFTVNTHACLSFSCAGGTGFIGSFTGGAATILSVYGDFTLKSTMGNFQVGTLRLKSTSTGKTLTCDGETIDGHIDFNGVGGGWQLQDNVVLGSGHYFYVTNGSLDFNDKNVTLSGNGFAFNGGATIDLGSSVLTSDVGWGCYTSNVTSGTSTIKISGTGSFVGNGETYYNVELNGTAHTISGSNTFNELSSATPATTKTITFTAGTTQTMADWDISGDATHTTTIVSSSAGNPAYLSASGAVTADYLSVKDSQASGTASWKTGANSTEVSGNSGWYFPLANPTNAYADDANYATATVNTSGDVSVQLSWDGGTSWTSALTETFGAAETTETFGDGATELWGRTWTGDDVDDTSFRLRIICGNKKQIYKTYGFAIGASSILQGIEVAIKGYWTAGTSTTSINHIKVKIYYSNTTLPVQAGSQVYASDGRKAGEGGGAGTGVLCFYDGSNWIACDTGATVAA